MRKEKYFDTEMTIIRFDSEDVIRTSVGTGVGEDGGEEEA